MSKQSEMARRRLLDRLADRGRFQGAEVGTERVEDVRQLRRGRRRRRKARSWADEYVGELMGGGNAE